MKKCCILGYFFQKNDFFVNQDIEKEILDDKLKDINSNIKHSIIDIKEIVHLKFIAIAVVEKSVKRIYIFRL